MPAPEPPSGIEAIEKAIDDHGASDDLQRLVDWGCDRAILLSHLGVIRAGDPQMDNLGFWTGTEDRRQLGVFAERVKKLAREIELLNEKPFRVTFVSLRGSGAALVALPTTLRAYASAVRDLLDEVSGQKHGYRDMFRAALVRYVVQKTGTFHDQEVAALVEAVRAKDNRTKNHFSTDTHKDWRLKKYDRLLHALDQLENDLSLFPSASTPPPKP